jgi:hypothetical protein
LTAGEEQAERLDAVAALIDLDLGASRQADAWIGLDGEPCSDNEAELITSATNSEWALAEGIRGAHGELGGGDSEAVAALLRFAAGSPVASALRLRLREAFLGTEPDDRAAVFAGVYQRLAAGLDDDARKRAAELLDGLR